MKKAIYYLLLSLLSFSTFGQVDSIFHSKKELAVNTKEDVGSPYKKYEFLFTVTEIQPSYINGGTNGFLKYIKDNLVFPKKAKENKVQGRVVVQFVVEKNGTVGFVKLLERLDYGCDEEAIRLIRTCGQWNPAIQNKMEVDCLFVVPIEFNYKKHR